MLTLQFSQNKNKFLAVLKLYSVFGCLKHKASQLRPTSLWQTTGLDRPCIPRFCSIMIMKKRVNSLWQVSLYNLCRYHEQGAEGTRSTTSTFHLLLDLMTFFDFYHSGRMEQAYKVPVALWNHYRHHGNDFSERFFFCVYTNLLSVIQNVIFRNTLIIIWSGFYHIAII